MHIITDRAALKRITALDARVRQLDADAASLIDQLGAARARRAALDGRLAEETSRPRPGDVATDDLAAALANDPTAAIGDAAAAALKKSRLQTAAHHDAAAAIEGVVAGAVAKVEAEISQLVSEQEDVAAARATAWAAFIQEAHVATLAEFRQRWEKLHADVVAPLMALATERRPGTTGAILDGRTGRFTDDSALKIRTYGEEGPRIEYLFNTPRGPGPVPSYAGAVDTFRATLPAA